MPPHQLVEGALPFDPAQFVADDHGEHPAPTGKVRTGVWEATPGENHSIKGETMEFCYILSGVIELTEQGQPPRIFRAGDSFVMKPGFVGVWRTIETVRKIFVCVYE